MQYPKIKSAMAINETVLLIEFNNNQKKKYDITPLLNKKIFSALKSSDLFKNVKVEQGGYAVFWNKDIDISEYELWTNGQTIK